MGSRRSLLAVAQSRAFASALEAAVPGVRVEFTGIETEGDRVLDKPLREVDGKEFFTGAIDDALLAGRVDFSVHSLKDLSLDRPPAFSLAAIPKREDPRDAVVFCPGIDERIRQGLPIRIGSSAPRREENTAAFLAKALPHGPSGAPVVQWVPLRGNVNTRLGRIRPDASTDRRLDAVVLAFAGLSRLWLDEDARRELTPLLDGVRWMLTPLRECPSAPGQGALAVECRADDAELRGWLRRLHDEPTAIAVAREREVLRELGGGCHQRAGAACIEHPALGQVLFSRGRTEAGVAFSKVEYPARARPPAGPVWDGSAHPGRRENMAPGNAWREAPAVFVAHSHAWPADAAGTNQRVFVSGSSTWFALAARGVWVEASADGLGFDFLAPTLGRPLLRLPPFSHWAALTSEDSLDAWRDRGFGTVAASYRVHPATDAGGIGQAAALWWSSPGQFDALSPGASATAHHACGPGRTATHLRSSGINVDVFPSVEEWRTWIGTR